MLCRPIPAVGRPVSRGLGARSAPIIVPSRCSLVVRAHNDEKKKDKEADKAEKEKEKYTGPDIVPVISELEGFLSAMVHETDIVEIELQVGNFELKVRRSVKAEAPAAAPAPAAVAGPPLALPKAEAPARPFSDSIGAEESVDESLLPVFSPKVGIFRRGRYAGNKRVGKGNCVTEMDKVKKGQAVGFVEQLGTFVAVESPQAGEVIHFDVKDGEAVEYLQTVLHVAPFFGGELVV